MLNPPLGLQRTFGKRDLPCIQHSLHSSPPRSEQIGAVLIHYSRIFVGGQEAVLRIPRAILSLMH